MLFVAKQPTTYNLESTDEWITPERARYMRDNMHFPRQRKIAKANIQRLAAEMKGGCFTPGTQIYVCVLPDGTRYIVNGNHTLEAVVESGAAQLLTITTTHVPDINAAGRIYAVFDTQKVRSWSDSRKAAGIGEDTPFVDKVLAAIKVIDRRFGNTGGAQGAASRSEIINFLPEYHEAAVLISEAISGAPSDTTSIIKRAGVLAVALETVKYQPSLGMEFWSNVAHDNGLTVGMPEKALLSYMRNNKMGGGGNMQTIHAKAAASAWNSKFKNETKESVKPNAIITFTLLGTRWDKGTDID